MIFREVEKIKITKKLRKNQKSIFPNWFLVCFSVWWFALPPKTAPESGKNAFLGFSEWYGVSRVTIEVISNKIEKIDFSWFLMFFDDFFSLILLFSRDLRSQIWDIGWKSYEKTFKLTVLRAQTELGGPPRHGNHPKST